MSAQRARAFDVVTAVWGRPYIEQFLEVAVPNQLTPGNVDVLPPGSRYRIFTTPEDARMLAASPALDLMRRRMPVDVELMPELSDSAVDPMDRLTAAHRRALADARESQTALIFLNADVFMSEGALAAVVRRHAAGSRAVVCTGIRLNREAFVEAVRARGVDALPPRELASLALNHLHAFTRAHMIDAERMAWSPISVYWNVPGEGILTRSFFLHPLMIDPVCRDAIPPTTIDAKYVARACPAYDQVHVVTDSDELCLFELSDCDAAVIETIPGPIPLWRAATIFTNGDSHQKRYWGTPIRLHVREIGAAWRTAEHDSAHFARRVKRLRLAVRWAGLTVQRVQRLERRGRWFKKRVLRAAGRLSPVRVQRFRLLAARRIGRLAEHNVRAVRLVYRRARRSALLLTHSASRPLHRFRKRAGRTGRKILRRARPA